MDVPVRTGKGERKMEDWKVYKYKLDIAATFVTLLMPKGARVLSCQLKGSDPVVWALVNTQEPLEEERAFLLLDTGASLRGRLKPDEIRFLATIQQGSVHFLVGDLE